MKRYIRIFLLASIILGLICANPVGATLTDNGDGTVTDNNRGDGVPLMWLQEPPQLMLTWDAAMEWADDLVFAGYDNWRLPSALNFESGLPDDLWNSVNNEWGHLYGVEWGNPASPSDTYPMIGYTCRWYWTSTEYVTPTIAYRFFVSYDGLWFHDIQPKIEMLCVTAVRDIETIEPGISLFSNALGILPIAILAVALIVHRRRRKNPPTK